MTPSASILRTNAALALAFLLSLPAPAMAAEPAKPATASSGSPSSTQLARLCADCEWVTEVHTESRQGQASGVGAAGGAVAGGVIGHKAGDSTVATLGGAVVGGLLGNALEKRMKKHTVWIVHSTRRDGRAAKHELGHDPQLHSGDVVRPEGGGLKRQ